MVLLNKKVGQNNHFIDLQFNQFDRYWEKAKSKLNLKQRQVKSQKKFHGGHFCFSYLCSG